MGAKGPRGCAGTLGRDGMCGLRAPQDTGLRAREGDWTKGRQPGERANLKWGQDTGQGREEDSQDKGHQTGGAGWGEVNPRCPGRSLDRFLGFLVSTVTLKEGWGPGGKELAGGPSLWQPERLLRERRDTPPPRAEARSF